MNITKNIEAWEESFVADEFHVQLGKRLDAAVNRGELKQCINNRGVRWGRVLTSEAVLAPLTQSDIRDLRLASGDVLVCEGGEIGRSSVWNGEIPEAYFLNTLHRLRPKSQYEPRLLVGVLEHWAKTGKLSALAGKSSLAHLTKENLLRVRIPVPPLIEQKQIVDSLLVIDELIATLERMISKKQEIKQGLMQQILTGLTRLPGFTEAWKSNTIGDLCAIRSGTPKVRSTGGRYLVIDMGSVNRNAELMATKRTEENSDLLHLGELVMPKDDIGGGNIIGRTGLINQSDTYVLADHVYALTPHRIYPDFLNLAINSYDVNISLRSQATGSAQLGLSRRSVLNQEVTYPTSMDEQRAIAEIISDADGEIELLKRRLDKAYATRVGMMQELLTGRTRLPPKESTA